MSEVYVNGERKRRLPLWMSGVAAPAPDQVEKSGNKNENISSSELNSLSKGLKPRGRRLGKKVEKLVGVSGENTVEVDSTLLVKYEKRKRVKKSRHQELDHDDFVNSEDDLPKKRTKRRVDVIGRKTKESTLPKKRTPKTSVIGSREEVKEPSTSEDDEELTVEDLVSIAEEYVEADKRKARQKQATTEPESTQIPPRLDFPRNKSGGSSAATQSNRHLPADTTTLPSSTFSMTRLQSQESPASDGNVSNPSRTGDPAQDMLDLFLGPLLRKPQTEERKLESIAEDIAVENEFRKHSGNEILGEKVVTLTKKKSSLKDKVTGKQ